ncbi:MAG: 6-bladed beta-propeller [Balneolaceae bacterium]
MLRYITFLILVTCMMSCSSREIEDETKNFSDFIQDTEFIAAKKVIALDDTDTGIYRPLDIVVDKKGRAIVADASNWSLHLLSGEGETISKAGIIGRGPEEFLGINQLEIDDDQKLTVVDKRSQRFSEFFVTDDSLVYNNSFAMPNYSSLVLETIQKTETLGNFGVFRTPNLSMDNNTTFEVHQLDSDYQITEKVFEIPGNETMMLGNYPEDHVFGFKSDWVTLGDTFYYARSNQLNFKSYNLSNGDSLEYEVSDVPKNQKSSEDEKFLINHLRPILQSYPSVKDEIEEREILPQFLSFIAGENYGYFTIFNMSNNSDTILMVEKETEEMKAIEVPPIFNLYAVYENEDDHFLYGVDHTNDNNQILIIQL